MLKLPKILRPGIGRLGTHDAKAMELDRLEHVRGHLASDYPKISIVIPSFNQAQFVQNTIASLVDQQYPNLEIIVIDGGSTDGSVELIRQSEDKVTWWVSEPDNGQADAINKGFSRSTGEILGWLNSDDMLTPGALHVIATHFMKHPKTDVVYGNRIVCDQNGMEIGRWILPGHSGALLHFVDFVPQETLYWRRKAWESVGEKLDVSFRFAMDWDLLLRFMAMKQRFVHLPHFLGIFRVHTDQKTSSQMTSLGMSEMNRLRQRELRRIPSVSELKLRTLSFVLRARFKEILRRS